MLKRLPVDKLQSLFDVITQASYQLIAPTVENDAIVYGPISSVQQLPIGMTDEQNISLYPHVYIYSSDNIHQLMPDLVLDKMTVCGLLGINISQINLNPLNSEI